jgi:hypothetical protein
MDSSNDYYTLELGLVKECNAQVRVDTWDVDIDLLNHVKNEFANSLPLSLYSKHFNYIIGYCVYLK